MVRSRSTAKQETNFAVAAQSGGGNGSGGEQQPWSRPGPLRCSCYCFALAELGQQRYNQHGPAHQPPSRLPQPSKLAVPLQLRTLECASTKQAVCPPQAAMPAGLFTAHGLMSPRLPCFESVRQHPRFSNSTNGDG